MEDVFDMITQPFGFWELSILTWGLAWTIGIILYFFGQKENAGALFFYGAIPGWNSALLFILPLVLLSVIIIGGNKLLGKYEQKFKNE